MGQQFDPRAIHNERNPTADELVFGTVVRKSDDGIDYGLVRTNLYAGVVTMPLQDDDGKFLNSICQWLNLMLFAPRLLIEQAWMGLSRCELLILAANGIKETGD